LSPTADPWVNLHVHSMFSLLDGVGSYEDYAKRLIRWREKVGLKGPGYLAATEHGSMRGIVRLQKVAEENDLRPIFGIEFYTAEDLTVKALSDADKSLVQKEPFRERRSFQARLEKYRGIRPRWHLTAWALNETGLRNLIRLSSIAWIDGFYYKPRIDFPTLEKYSDGIAIGSACLAGPLCSPVLDGEPSVAVENAVFLKDVFGDRFYVEIMANGIPEQDRANRALVRIARRLDLPLIATVDSHYTQPRDWRLQEALLCVQTNDKIANPKRFQFSSRDFWYKTGDEVRKGFRQYHPWLKTSVVRRAIRTTAELAERCEATLTLDPLAALLPTPSDRDTTPEEDFEALRDLCVEGWVWRRIEDRAKFVAGVRKSSVSRVVKEYKKRLAHELRVLREKKFSRYILVLYDLVQWARDQGIFVGPGRGSAAGCLVAYLVGVTSMDPVEHGLLFERFLPPGRVDFPDIDVDFEKERRPEVIQYLVDKYGRGSTAQISTYSTMKGRGCFRDVARVYSVSTTETNRVASAILQRLPGHEREDHCIEDSLDTSPECKAFRKKNPVVFSVAERLEGTIRQVGLHAAGVVVTPNPLIEIVPLESRVDPDTKARVPVIAVDFRDAQELGLIKLDALGLKHLTAIRHSLQAVEDLYGGAITLEDLESEHYQDPKVLGAFDDPANRVGVFQFDSPTMSSIMTFPVTRFEDLVALNALNRPGAMRSGLARRYAARARKGTKPKKVHPILDRITFPTLGVLCYQEQVTRVFVELAGYDPGDADKIRKKIGKSEGEKAIAPEKTKFVTGAVDRGLDEDKSKVLFAQILKFGGYAFNKSHAAAYSALAYWEMRLLVEYPDTFFLGLLQAEDQLPKVARYIETSARHGVDVLPPDVNESTTRYRLVHRNTIRCPLTGLKGIGAKAADSIVNGQPFRSVADLVNRTDSRAVTSKALEVLAQAGALDKLAPNRRYLVENAKSLAERIRKKDGESVDTEISLSGSSPDYSKTERTRRAIEIGVYGPGHSPLDAYADLWEDLESHGVEFVRLSDIDWNESLVWVRAVAREAKAITTDDGRVANMVLTDGSGPDIRARVETKELDRFERAATKAQGKAVLVRAGLNAKSKGLRVLKVFLAEDFHAHWRSKELTDEEKRVFRHPLHGIRPRYNVRKAIADEDVGLLSFVGRIESVKIWEDRKKKKMAFFDVQAWTGSIPVVCFGSSFPSFKNAIYSGAVVKIEVLRGDGPSWVLDSESGCSIKDLGY